LILQVARSGDLVLRDLGYFVLENFGKMMQSGIFFISKLKVKTSLYDPQNGEQISLLTLLKGKIRSNSCYMWAKKQVAAAVDRPKITRRHCPSKKRKG